MGQQRLIRAPRRRWHRLNTTKQVAMGVREEGGLHRRRVISSTHPGVPEEPRLGAAWRAGMDKQKDSLKLA